MTESAPQFGDDSNQLGQRCPLEHDSRSEKVTTALLTQDVESVSELYLIKEIKA
ncbi:MAG: hypothetical protein ABEI98_05535 [Halorhabdus sp.]